MGSSLGLLFKFSARASSPTDVALISPGCNVSPEITKCIDEVTRHSNDPHYLLLNYSSADAEKCVRPARLYYQTTIIFSSARADDSTDIGSYNTEACGWDGGDCCECDCEDGEADCGVAGYACKDPYSTCGEQKSRFRLRPQALPLEPQLFGSIAQLQPF